MYRNRSCRQRVDRKQDLLERAIEDFRTSLDGRFEVLASARGLAQCLAEEGRLKEAKQVCDSALPNTSAGAGETELLLVRAAIQYALGNVTAGLADSRAAGKGRSDLAEARLLEGYGYALARQWRLCEAKCVGGLDLNPQPHVAARLLLLYYTAAVRHDDPQVAIRFLASHVQKRNIPLTLWPGPIVQALIAKQPFQQLAAALSAESDEHITKRRLCEALYYFGVRDFADGQIGPAKTKWGRAMELGARQQVEFILAASDQQRLGS